MFLPLKKRELFLKWLVLLLMARSAVRSWASWDMPGK